jgi:hypothetical protein
MVVTRNVYGVTSPKMSSLLFLRHTSSVATTPQDSGTTGPTIVESYRDFEPPVNFRQSVETLLRYVPPKYLVGLETIVLTNRASLNRDVRKQKVWSRNRKVRLAESLGSYSRSWKSSPAAVWLYVDNIVEAGATWFKWFPVLRYAMPAEVLYHEIGHHIHTVHRPLHEGRENVADDWRRKLWANVCRRHYWYLYPLLYVLARIASLIVKRLKRMKNTS